MKAVHQRKQGGKGAKAAGNKNGVIDKLNSVMTRYEKYIRFLFNHVAKIDVYFKIKLIHG